MKRVLFFFQSLFLLLLSIFIKRNDKKIAIGSWNGELFIDNSKYLAEYIREKYPDFFVLWIGNTNIKEQVQHKGIMFAKKNNFLTNIRLLSCKYMFFSQMASADISNSNVFRGAVTCYLHHGMPIKKWGDDDRERAERIKKMSFLKRLYVRVTGEDIKYCFFATSSTLHDISNCTSLKSRGCDNSKNLKCGTPRNDYLINSNHDEVDRVFEKYNESFSIDRFDKIILYLPTYRRKSLNIFSFANLSENNRKQLVSLLEKHNAVILEKSHFAEKNLVRKKTDIDRVIFLGKDVNVQELYLISDFLISDYSGAFLDYLFLNKPIIHFAYDYEFYRDIDSGLYYEIDDFSAGPVAKDLDSLMKTMDETLLGEDSFKSKRKYVKEKYMSYEKGDSSQKIFEKVILNNGKNK